MIVFYVLVTLVLPTCIGYQQADDHLQPPGAAITSAYIGTLLRIAVTFCAFCQLS